MAILAASRDFPVCPDGHRPCYFVGHLEPPRTVHVRRGFRILEQGMGPSVLAAEPHALANEIHFGGGDLPSGVRAVGQDAVYDLR